MKSCVRVSIVDDELMENDESFNVTLERTADLDSRIRLDPVVGVVEITDNDGRYRMRNICTWWCTWMTVIVLMNIMYYINNAYYLRI